jgi:uncharacterized repeat protein (TIGR01451 family)
METDYRKRLASALSAAFCVSKTRSAIAGLTTPRRDTMPRSLIRALLAPILMLLITGHAFAAPEISLSIMAEKDVVETDANGQQITRRVAASDTVPGDILFYTIRYRNSGDESARNIQLDNPVPEGTAFQENSAWGDGSDILFSIDGGKTFKKASSLTYQVTGRDGRTEERRAAPEQYNAIRWTVTEVPSGAEGSAGFSVIVQ